MVPALNLADVGGPPRRGHHMGDFIPDEELQSFLAKTTPGGRAPPSEDRNKIGASNVGHKLLSKMGWTEGKDGWENLRSFL